MCLWERDGTNSKEREVDVPGHVRAVLFSRETWSFFLLSLLAWVRDGQQHKETHPFLPFSSREVSRCVGVPPYDRRTVLPPRGKNEVSTSETVDI